MSNSTSKAFYFIYAFKIGDAWKYLLESLGTLGIESVPQHIAEAHFNHLWKTDDKFQELSLSWLSETSIDMMDVVKSFTFSESKTNKPTKIILTESQLGGKSKGISSKIIDHISKLDKEISTSDLAKNIFGKSPSYKQKQSVYMSLYFLHKKGLVDKTDGTNKGAPCVFWKFIGQTPKLSGSSQISKPTKTNRKQRDYVRLKESIINLIKSSDGLSTTDIRVSLEKSGLLEKNNYKSNDAFIYSQLHSFKSKGMITNVALNPKAKADCLKNIVWKSTVAN